MLAGILGPLLITAAGQSAPAVTAEIVVPPKAPLAVLLVNPSGVTGRTRGSDVIDVVDRLVAKHTDFFVARLDAGETAACEGRLACIAQLARPDYDRLDYELGTGAMAPFSEHVEHVTRRRIAYPAFLLIISHITGDARDRLSVTFIDTDRALAAIHAQDPRAEGAAAELEVAVRQTAVRGEPQWGEAEGPEAARAFFEKIFTGPLRRHLEDAGHWEPRGALEILGAEAGLGVELDGDTVGTTGAGVTRVTGVPAGPHRIRLYGPGVQDYEAEVSIARRETTSLRPPLRAQADPTTRGLRQGLIWTGVGLAVAGAVIGGVALGRQDGDVVTYCPTGPDGGGCDGQRFITSGFDATAAPTFGDEVNPGGVLLGPLGYSLALTGATWSLSTLLFGDEADLPWWQLAAGLVAGGAAYGISAALDPGSPF